MSNTTGKKFGGRQKGTPNKQSKDLREWITNFIHGNTKQIEDDWKALEPKDRLIMFEKLLKYTLPQLQAVSSSIRFEDMTEEQLDEIIERLKQGNQ